MAQLNTIGRPWGKIVCPVCKHRVMLHKPMCTNKRCNCILFPEEMKDKARVEHEKYRIAKGKRERRKFLRAKGKKDVLRKLWKEHRK